MLTLLKTRNVELYDALKLFALEALTVIEAAITKGAVIPTLSEFEWVQNGEEDSFSRQQANKAEYFIFIYKMQDSIIELDSFKAAEAQFLTDAIWGSQVNKLIGNIMGRRRLELHQLLLGIPAYTLRKSDSVEFSERYFNEQVGKFESFFMTQIFEHKRITPVYGLSITTNFMLTETISIEPLTNEDVIEFLDLGLISSQFSSSSFGDFIHQVPRTAIISRFSLPKVVGEDNLDADVMTTLNDTTNSIYLNETKVIDLLTLILNVAVTPAASIMKCVDSMIGTRQLQAYNAINAWTLPKVALEENAQNMLLTLWPMLGENSPKSRHFLTIAVRRYSLAISRQALDDKLIDLMICAEALFLRTDQNELSFQLAYKAALLLGENSEHKKEIFEFMKSTYNIRSKVVHGAKSFTQNQKDSQHLSETTTKLAELLRNALLKMLNLALNPQASKELVDWKELMFSEEQKSNLT